jgi:ABC-type phosphate transport system permease subunit
MNIGKSFSFVFEDPRWVTKVGIGTLVLILSSLLSSVLIGILGYFIIAGYGLEVLRNVRKGELYPMPEWRDRWGEWLVLGVKAAVAVLVWSLPTIIIALPMGVGLALLGNNDSTAAWPVACWRPALAA